MKHFKTESFCLKIGKCQKNSAILYFFTKEFGTVSVYQKGYFSKNSKFKQNLDLGQESELVLNLKDDRFYLHEITLISINHFKSYVNLTIFSYVAEILSHLPQNMEINSNFIYLLLQNLIYILAQNIGKFNSLLNFQFKLLHHLGFIGDIKHCNMCNKKFNTEENTVSLLQEINLICSGCIKKWHKTINLSAQERLILCMWLQEDQLTSKYCFSKHSILKIQTLISSVYENMFKLKATKSLLEVINAEIKN